MAFIDERKAGGASSVVAPAAAGVQVRHVRPVKWWAALGVVYLVVLIYCYTRWIIGPDFRPVDPGPTPVPTAMQVGLVALTVLGFILTVVAVYAYLIKPWRRDGRLSFEGLFLLACTTMVWQDGLPNMFRHVFAYNASMTNFGSWYEYLPFWVSPNANRAATPIIWDWPVYAYFFLPATLFGAYLMRKVKERYPAMGKFGVVAISFSILMVVDFLIELPWTRLGVYTWAGAYEPLTLFYGHYYQFPLYECPLIAGMWTGWSCLLYFRDDKGQTLVERGIGEIRLGTKTKTFLRWLALVGVANLGFMAYNLSGAFIGIYQTGWPEDVQQRSYFAGELCNGVTKTSCPSENLPIDKLGSFRIAPDGSLIAPPGESLPPVVPTETK